MKADVSHSRRLNISQAAVCRSIVLLEDKELARNLTHDRQQLPSQQHGTAVCTINLHPRIDKYQVRFPKLGYDNEHHQ